jgi:hypothetical protein
VKSKGFGRKRSWPNCKVLSRNLSGEIEKNHENLSQNNRSPGRDLKPGPPAYEAGVLTSRQRRSVPTKYQPRNYPMFPTCYNILLKNFNIIKQSRKNSNRIFFYWYCFKYWMINSRGIFVTGRTGMAFRKFSQKDASRNGVPEPFFPWHWYS